MSVKQTYSSIPDRFMYLSLLITYLESLPMRQHLLVPPLNNDLDEIFHICSCFTYIHVFVEVRDFNLNYPPTILGTGSDTM